MLLRGRFPTESENGKEQRMKEEFYCSPHDLVVLINISEMRDVWPSVLLDGSTKTDNPYSSLSDISQPLVVWELNPRPLMPQGTSLQFASIFSALISYGHENRYMSFGKVCSACIIASDNVLNVIVSDNCHSTTNLLIKLR